MTDSPIDLPVDFTHAQDFINPLLSRAIAAGVSDLHFERQHDTGIVRVRGDGIMREWVRLSMEQMDLLISRLKFISGVDPMEKGALQQARFTYKHDSGLIDMRVSVLPTPNMEDMVIRILSSKPEVMKIDEMGLPEHILEGLKKAALSHTGLVFVTGPTGSGKTTTLYALIDTINDGNRKIITVEDPIEYRVPGLTQLKLIKERGLNYAGILKTILRHDPDVILIGETRDQEAAEIAVEASMTGHLVLTTLHTNSAAQTILRLINLGIPGPDVANAVTAFYAQRLVKTLCPHCREEIPAPEAFKQDMKELNPELDCPDKIFIPKGCEACDGTGYKGRAPIGELLLMDDVIRDVIYKQPTLTALNAAAAAAGMKTMKANGLALVAQGRADYDDIIRTVG
jgi:type II secretory ATPase GspE/PulE/Tfp pilus assembly ATPase PilB-like protein